MLLIKFMVSEELQKLFDVKAFVRQQRREFNKIFDVIEKKLDEKYPGKKEGTLNIKLRELVKEAGCKLDFEVPDVAIKTIKTWSADYRPTHHSSFSFHEFIDDGEFNYKNIEEKLRERKEHYSKESKCDQDFLHAQSAAPLYEKTLEKFFGK